MPSVFRDRRLFPSSKIFEGVDATDRQKVSMIVRNCRPDVVVNAVGLIKQLPTGQERAPAIRVNALFPHELYEIARAAGARFLHFSTDCVFRGDRGNYTEDDPSDALDIYGRTKFLGEVDGPGALTLRTSIVGRQLRGQESLIEWFLRQPPGTVAGYTNAVYSGVTTDHLADLVAAVISRHPGLEGVYHVAGPVISKFELLTVVRDVLGTDVTILPDDDYRLDRSLNDQRFREVTSLQTPPWKEMILEMASNPIPYKRP
jgi:dTDP-4-dehydrorhamnose reductase